MVDPRVEVDAATPRARAALHFAVGSNDRNVVKALSRDERADPNAQITQEQSGGWGPLHFACRLGHLEIAKLPVDFDADPRDGACGRARVRRRRGRGRPYATRKKIAHYSRGAAARRGARLHRTSPPLVKFVRVRARRRVRAAASASPRLAKSAAVRTTGGGLCGNRRALRPNHHATPSTARRARFRPTYEGALAKNDRPRARPLATQVVAVDPGHAGVQSGGDAVPRPSRRASTRPRRARTRSRSPLRSRPLRRRRERCIRRARSTPPGSTAGPRCRPAPSAGRSGRVINASDARRRRATWLKFGRTRSRPRTLAPPRAPLRTRGTDVCLRCEGNIRLAADQLFFAIRDA